MEIISKKINKKLINEEEDENDLIINNDDDFCGENEQISPQKNNLKIKDLKNADSMAKKNIK